MVYLGAASSRSSSGLLRSSRSSLSSLSSSSSFTSRTFIPSVSSSRFTFNSFQSKINNNPYVSSFSIARSHSAFFSTRSFSFQAALAQEQSQPHSEESNPTNLISDSTPKVPQFSDLKGSISPQVYKALTGDPFNYTTMSEVQSRVLTLLPELSQPATQVDAPGRNKLESEESSGEKDPLRSNIGMVTSDGLGKDLLVKARTGTGKTLAFLVPAIEARIRSLKAVEKGLISSSFHKLLQKNRPDLDFSKLDKKQIQILVTQYSQNSVGTLILSPTRELATQIAEEAKKLHFHNKELNVQLLVGGQPKYQQLNDWRKSRPDVVVSTPGRLLDLANDVGMIREALAATERLILDEADTLLELGFRDDIQRILDFLPGNDERITSLFSATVSKEIKSIAKETLNKSHRFIDCVPKGEDNVHKHIPQYFSIVDSKNHLKYLIRLISHDQLTNIGKSKVIIFCPTTKQTELMSAFLRSIRSLLPNGSGSPNRTGGEIYEIHSKKDQSQRFKVSDRFRKDKRGGSILVTSDVSARGVDYPGTTRVIQIGVPSSKDQYVHRVGRTGRAGKDGRGDLLLMDFEKSFVDFQLNDLPVKNCNESQIEKELEELVEKFDNDPESIIDPEILKLMNSSSSDSTSSSSGSGFSSRSTKFGRKSSPNRSPSVSDASSKPLMIKGPLKERLSSSNIETSIQEAISEIPDYQDRVRETFGSMLGYYMGRTGEVRCSKPEMLDSLKDFAVGGLKADSEPYVSSNMLQVLGIFGGGGRGGGGGGRGGYGGRGGPSRFSGGGGGDRDKFFGGDRFGSGGGGGGRGGDRFGGGEERSQSFGRNNYGKQGRNGPGGYGGGRGRDRY